VIRLLLLNEFKLFTYILFAVPLFVYNDETLADVMNIDGDDSDEITVLFIVELFANNEDTVPEDIVAFVILLFAKKPFVIFKLLLV